MPFGWFSVGRLDELTEPVTTVDAFGSQVVVWRDEDDTLHVFDPVCPHMGAHLGVGGEVVGQCLRCPFHHWEFDGDGANTLIPYAEKVNRKARVYAYPTAIANGHLLAWYHPDRSVAPTFAVPDQLGADMVFGGKFDRVVRAQWQEIAENSVDMPHFHYVHGTGQINPVGKMTMDGPFRRVESQQAFNSSKGPITGDLFSNSFGPGIGLIEFHLFATVTLISAITNAEQQVYITAAYFVPDPQLLKALLDAAGRGVDVRLILPSHSDSSVVFHAGRSHYTRLLEGGVRLYERRGAQGWTSCFLQLQLRQAQGEKIDANKAIAEYFSGEGREDLNRIMTLSPTNYLAIGTAVLSVAVPSMVMMKS